MPTRKRFFSCMLYPLYFTLYKHAYNLYNNMLQPDSELLELNKEPFGKWNFEPGVSFLNRSSGQVTVKKVEG